MTLLRTAFILMCLSCALAADEVHKLTVTGNSTLYKTADKVMLKLGMVTNEKNVKKAVQANNEKMQDVLSALKEAGLSQKEFQTGNFTIEPQYTPRPKEIPADWHQEIIGYEVRNTVSISTVRMELTGPVIDAATHAGANLVEDIIFSIQDKQEAESEAIATAVKQARTYAEAAAKAAGITLGDIIELSINPIMMVPRFFKAQNVMLAAAANAQTPIVPGDVEVSATVSIFYGIESHNQD